MVETGTHLLDAALSPQRVFLTRETSKEKLLQFLVDQLGQCGEVDDVQALHSAIFTRESLMSTGIGLGIGVPHARISSVRRMILAVAVNAQPLEDYEAIDNLPVQIVFMVAGRPDQQSNYVRLLAVLSHVVKQENNRKAILSSTTPEEIYQTIRQAL
ncbi:PTS sugar transporter subunit IIA [Kiritimatiellaeota bacterium B1221]|nr:PTS sugar transporter subunit IIA [Kiritimatiellaeota bacterium B1221]